MQSSISKIKIRKLRLSSYLDILNKTKFTLHKSVEQLNQQFKKKFTSKMKLMPIKLSIGQSKGNVQKQKLLQIKKQEEELIQKFEMASDPIADSMQVFVNRVKQLSDVLKNLKDKTQDKYNIQKEKKKQIMKKILSLRLKCKSIQNQNIQIAHKIKNHKSKKHLKYVASLDSIPAFVSQPQITKCLSGDIFMLDNSKEQIDLQKLQQKQRKYLGKRLSLQKLNWRKDILFKIVQSKCCKIQNRIKKTQRLNLLLQIMREKARSYQSSQDQIDIKLSQLKDKRLFYRFIFAPYNFNIIQIQINQIIQGMSNLISI